MAEKKEKALAIGMACVEHGPYLGDGLIATSFKEVEDVYKGSVVFNISDTTEVKIEVEKLDDPRWIINMKGDADSFEFAIPSPTSEDMKEFCGGTVTGGKWDAPIGTPTIEKSFRMKTKPYKDKYVEYVIINGSVSAKLSQAPGKEQTDLLLVKFKKQAAITAEGVVKSSFSREIKDVQPAV